MSRMSHDRMRAENQRREFARGEALHRLQVDAVLLANEGSHMRVETKRRQRVLAEQQREIDTLTAMDAKQQADEARRVQEQQQALLAREMEQMARAQTVDERRRQQLRDASAELRDLETKLKIAYMNKEIQAQRAERDTATRTLRETDVLVEQQLNALRAQEDEAEQARTQQVAVANRKHQQELLQQLSSQQEQQRAAYEEFLKEKLLIDDIVRKIHEEDQHGREAEMQRKAQTRKEMEDFKAQQEQWRAAEAQQMAKENEDIVRFAQAQTARSDERKAAERQRAQERAALQDRIAQQVEGARVAKEELVRLRDELYEQEMHAQERQREAADLEARLRARLALRREQEEDIEARQRLKEQEKAEEDEFRKALMDKFAVDDKLEQMNAAKRRLKQQEHKRAVEALLDERRQRFQFEQQQQRAEAAQARADEAARREIIEQERVRLLQEHAHRLLGFLPKGVIRDARDLDLLGDSFKAAYAPPPPLAGDDDDEGGEDNGV